jgi:hypothetical protein
VNNAPVEALQDIVVAGNKIIMSDGTVYTIYNVMGQVVGSGVYTQPVALRRGFYIVNRKKIFIN